MSDGWTEPTAEVAAAEFEVVETAQAPAAIPEPRARKPRPGPPKWEIEARDRVKAAIRRYAKPLADLIARDANEGDTRLLVTDFLCEALGYDKYEDLTTEYQVKGEFADYGVRIDKQLVAFIEVKRCAQRLSEKHLRQVEMYAVNEGVEWCILTNGQTWQVWHLTGGLPVVMDMALEVDLLGESGLAHKADQMYFLTREAFKRHQIDELWKQKVATSPKSLASILLSESVTEAVRKELRRASGQHLDTAEIARLLRETVIRPEVWS
jgi:predicted type IV restriction endonuclease